MKPIKISFLFLFVILLSATSVAGQEAIDSSYAYYNKIIKPKTEKDLIEGYKYYLNQSDLNLKANDTINAIQNLRLVVMGMFKAGLFFESEAIAVDALKLLDTKKTSDSLSYEARMALNNHLGITNRQLKNYRKAIAYYSRIVENAQTEHEINTAIKNRAKAYTDSGAYTIAHKDYLKAYEASMSSTDTLSLARYLDNLGYVQSKLKLPEALGNLEHSLSLRLNKDYWPGLITSYLHLAEFYHDRNQEIEALSYINKALKIAVKFGNKNYELNVLSKKIDFRFFTDIERYKYLSDSINNSKLKKEIRFSSLKYEYEKHERKAKELELDNEKQKTNTTIAISITICIALFAFFLYLFLKSKHKKEKQQEVFNTESRISKRVHDGIANDIFQVMTTLQADKDLNDSLKYNIEHIYEKARDISKQLGEIDINEDYKTLLNDLALSFNNADTSIVVKDISKITWDKISKTKKTALYKVLQELLINMKKHSKATIAVITFANASKKIDITYKDDGVGCDLKKSNGLLNVENRIKAIDGTITFESKFNNGFKAKIQI